MCGTTTEMTSDLITKLVYFEDGATFRNIRKLQSSSGPIIIILIFFFATLEY
jgi:hypothetical protein